MICNPFVPRLIACSQPPRAASESARQKLDPVRVIGVLAFSLLDSKGRRFELKRSR
ncbi:predicted protein [Plenodomus lingam JN3]|uniref:Predicted protein n=1 Tax=Leptosphaeria maculans (strain JN3 / isolate v23.1.3 / race Av1-4-5-6-7-8) TaxID=985895 RepID=E4ZPM8_LEPMJ|nr:predicted protein [Plenodomus lingam JN3]CBX93413.1 predicted protein [Plenodomus lingam JN3]